MAPWNFSAVLLIPLADQADGNAIAEVLGYGPDSFTLMAGPEGGEPSHWYGHTFAAQSFVDMVQALGSGGPPDGMPNELLPALSRMIISVKDGGNPLDHIDEVLSNNNLVMINK